MRGKNFYIYRDQSHKINMIWIAIDINRYFHVRKQYILLALYFISYININGANPLQCFYQFSLHNFSVTHILQQYKNETEKSLIRILLWSSWKTATSGNHKFSLKWWYTIKTSEHHANFIFRVGRQFSSGAESRPKG